MSNLPAAYGPVEGVVVVYVLMLMTTCPYFDILKYDVYDAVVLNATISRLECVQANFHVSTEVQSKLISCCLISTLV